MDDIKLLHKTLESEFGKRGIEATTVPEIITTNLNQKLQIRPYQTRAFQYFIKYWTEKFDGKPNKNQLLFHMATGSGKTLMMAGLILYLYEQGYRNFLFFVNSTNIIDKTRDNFFNDSSIKYLFNTSITQAEKKIITFIFIIYSFPLAYLSVAPFCAIFAKTLLYKGFMHNILLWYIFDDAG